MQSVLKIGFVVAKKGGIGGGGRVLARGAMHMTVALVEKLWSVLAGPFLSFLTQMGVDKALGLFRGSISVTLDSFQSGEAFTG